MLSDRIPLSTYTAGVLQAKAYRNLSRFMTSHLEQHGLSLPAWALLGTLHDQPNEGYNLAEIADLLDVQPPFVTNLVDALEKKRLVTRKEDTVDRRVKRVYVTAKGQKLVPEIERQLRRQMREYLSGVGFRELAGYVRVLQKISRKRSE